MSSKNTAKTSVALRTLVTSSAAGMVAGPMALRSAGQGIVSTDAARIKHAKLTGLLHNEDCTNIFGYQDFPAGQAGEVVDRYVDVLAGAGVNLLMINTNSRRTNYRSKVWEAFWDGYDPDGDDEQPFLKAVPQEQRQRYRKLVGNMLEVHRQGVDYPARVIQRCRHHGIAPWISIRMNDVHCNDNLDHPFHSALWRRPELFRQGDPGYFAKALDFAHTEVRRHYQALIVETLEQYDIDGLELDFMREPYLFSVGREQEGRVLLTQWLQEIRNLADRAATRRGHTVRLGVRMPSCPDTALGLGLDAPVWAQTGLVDLVVVAPRWSTLEFAMPLGTWRELLGDCVSLAGGLEVNYCPHPTATQRMVTPEEAAGAALAVLSDGADAVYLFNYFQTSQSHPGWQLDDYQRTLRSFSSLPELLKRPRRHAVTYRDVTMPREEYHPPLPASGKELVFDLVLGPALAAGWQIESAIEIAELPDGSALPSVTLNGVAGKLLRVEKLEQGMSCMISAIPRTALTDKIHDKLEIKAVGDGPVKVERVEIAIREG